MLRELAAETQAGAWAIASMLFFLSAFLVVAVRVWRAVPAETEACARLPLADDPEPTAGKQGGELHQGHAAPKRV